MKTMNEEVFSKENVFGKGQSNTAYAQYFIGESFLNPLTSAGHTCKSWNDFIKKNPDKLV